MSAKMPSGASFLLHTPLQQQSYIPEQASAEDRDLAKLAFEFSRDEVVPHIDALEAGDHALMVKLFKKAGELGLLMPEVPAEYGGLGLGKIPATFIGEGITHEGSFLVTVMCHTGIGTLPLVYFGTDAQKRKYLPKLATGEWIAAYSLTEAGSGSDALAARARAELTADGKHYALNGEKLFVTNGGFADLYTVFAKVDGEKFTAFLVERDTPGLELGREEKKMGMRGSSTRQIILKEAKVPVENVLGEIGKGHRIAFNVLNVGRWKLGAACVGNAKRILEIALPYINQRQQFGQKLSSFAMIRRKVAMCGMLLYLAESMVYRYAGTLDDARARLDAQTPDYDQQQQGLLKEFAVEASICKVFCSEALQVIADEAVQMLGGYGYCADYQVERHYRDCRINRIWEGTNEINRLLIAGTVFKRALSGELDLMGRLQEILGQLKSGFPSVPAHEYMATEIDAVEATKRLGIYVAGVALQRFGAEIDKHEVIMAFVADAIIDSYALESAVMRTRKIAEMHGESAAVLSRALCRAALAHRLHELYGRARQQLLNIADGDLAAFEPYAKAWQRLQPHLGVSTAREGEIITQSLIDAEQYRVA